MRTKILLLTAALSLAGIATSMAQVYSQNVVGYVNVPLPANNGFTMIANPLDTGSNTLGNVFTSPPAGFTLLKWNGAGYSEYDYLGGGPGANWYGVDEDDFVDQTVFANPGTGFFVKKPGVATNLTFVGNVLTGTQTVALVSGYNLVGSKIPLATNATGLGLTAALHSSGLDYVLKWAPGFSQYNRQADGTWYSLDADDLIEPTFNVGEGFFVRNLGGGTNWTKTFTLP